MSSLQCWRIVFLELSSEAAAETDKELEHRMRTLRLTVGAIAALAERGEDDPSPEEVRTAMRALALRVPVRP